MPSPETKGKALIVGVAAEPAQRWTEAERLEELAGLVQACGWEVFELMLQIKAKPDPGFYIGSGKARDIADIAREYGLGLVVFDAPLSGSQARNLETVIGTQVVDRTEIIMHIFAMHAATPEAKLQVKLAQLQYQASRLRGMWSHLDRLGGGISTRGPGEKQLEADRRKVNQEIVRLKAKLAEVQKSKSVQRAQRKNMFKITLVGYTNAGKSSVMNALTQAHQQVDDQPFTTLDPLTRNLSMSGVPVPLLLTDTVGFIEDLPPDLIASFKATLDVVRNADLLLHIADASHPKLQRRVNAVDQVLEELGASAIPTIRVFNKADLLLSDEAGQRLLEKHENAVLISARTRAGMQHLTTAMVDAFRSTMVKFRVKLPHSMGGQAYNKLISRAIITQESVDEEGVHLSGYAPVSLAGFIEELS